jgi:hypothetical protein
MFKREPARRVFAQEFAESNLTFKEVEVDPKFSPRFLLTQTGAKCGRLFIVGTLIERDEVGSGGIYRAKVADPTGSFPLFSGQFQKDATQFLASAEIPSFVAVVGKIGAYEAQGDETDTRIFVRPESFSTADLKNRNIWVIDTARQTLQRIKRMKDDDAEDAVRAREHYKTDAEHYKKIVIKALESLRDESEAQTTEVKIVDLM